MSTVKDNPIKRVYKAMVGAFNLLPKSVQLIKENLGLFALVNSVPLLLTLLSVLNGKDAESSLNASGNYNINWAAALGVGAGFAAIFMVITVVLQIMALKLTLDVASGGKSTASKLWEFAREYFFRLIGMGIVAVLVLIGVILVVMGIPTALFSALGSPALGLVVGITLTVIVSLVLTARYYFTPYLMIDKDLGIMDSFAASKELSEGRSLQVLSIIFVVIVLSVVPTVLGRVGELIASLLGIAYSVAPALRYLELKKLK